MQHPYYLHTLIILGLFVATPIYAETIDLQLRWHHQFQFAGYYAALQQGYYKQAGLDVVIHEGTPDKIPVAEVLQNHAQYGVANSDLVLARLKGDPLVVLAAIGQHSPSVLLARKELSILSPSDLIGKKVMMIGAKMDADFAVMFSNERISAGKLQIIPSSFDIQDLATGKVDAFNSYLSNEPELDQPKWEDFLAVVHPDDRQIVINATNEHINNGKPYDVEYRISNTKQQLRWMRSVGRIDKTKSYCFRGITHDITDKKKAEEQIKQLAFYDSLTLLPNRRLLYERLQQSIKLARRENTQRAVLMLDLDRFKAINDSFGHKAGDELLQQVAERISAQLRKVDTVARLGGDEFVVLLVNVNRSEDVERVALAIITELSRPFVLRKTDTVAIGTSIGISFYPQHGDSPEILMDVADSALYQAKEQGRGRFCIAAVAHS